MLKIKDKIDLRVLEKYGFKLISDYYLKDYSYNLSICINCKSRAIETSDYIDWDELGATIYDLIIAGLVEKAEG